MNKLKEKLKQLEKKHQSILERQDAIDSLALDTLFKMEALMAKMKTTLQIPNMSINESNQGEFWNNLDF